MKKSLVLAMAMAMGVTASAYAANPFADVPAGHWAYDSVAQLAAAGVVEGYGDGFGGDKLMTRYEMAQVVAKAMAKGGNCDKLAAEFADELDALGVRVAKLEKKVDNVKIAGNIRYSYADNTSNSGKKLNGAGQYNRFRTRLFVNGAINNNWSYTGMLENDRMLGSKKSSPVAGCTAADPCYDETPGTVQRDGDKVNLKRAFLNGRVGGVKVTAGRVYAVQGDMIDANSDGIMASYKWGKVNFTGWALKNVDGGKAYTTADDGDRVYMLKADTKFDKLGVFAQYWKVDGTKAANSHDKECPKYAPAADASGEIFELGVTYPVAKDLKLNAQYYHGFSSDLYDDGDDNGWEAGLTYRGAKAAKPGTWGLWFTYSDRPASTFIKPTAWNTYAYNDKAWYSADGDGYKGFELGGNYTLAKNIVAEVRYFDYNVREGADKKVKTLWSHVVFTF